MILVTGAAGKTGRAIIRALTARGREVKAIVHRPELVRPVQELGARETLVGDMRDQTTMDQAAQNVRAVYHIPPNIHPDEALMGSVVLAASVTAGVSHFVYHSVLRPQIEAMPHHWLKMRVEEQVFRSGLSFTILQPAVYMHNVIAQREQITSGVYPIPYSVATRLSYVDLKDVAAVAARVIDAPDHFGASYELVGTDGMSQAAVATALGARLGRPVQAVEVSLEHWEAQAKAVGHGSYQIETLLAMFRYYAQNGFAGNRNVLAWLLHREPTGLPEFLERMPWDQ
jgi:uncharacterized protein YbjT (DUF2867 family)